MKRIIAPLILCGLFACPSQARTVHLRGDRADAFIAAHFPDAEIPGPVHGRFTDGAPHHRRRGRAVCFVPAMGARSDGAVSTCKLVY
jgi:hypothetical protein